MPRRSRSGSKLLVRVHPDAAARFLNEGAGRNSASIVVAAGLRVASGAAAARSGCAGRAVAAALARCSRIDRLRRAPADGSTPRARIRCSICSRCSGVMSCERARSPPAPPRPRPAPRVAAGPPPAPSGAGRPSGLPVPSDPRRGRLRGPCGLPRRPTSPAAVAALAGAARCPTRAAPFPGRARWPCSGGVCPSAANISFVGRKRSAEFGTRSTLFRRAISMLTLAVMPGFSFSSGFGTSITVA